MNMQLSELASRIDGQLQGADAHFSGVGTDTRSLQPNQLYVALRGENFDGHDFLRKAASLGAAGALVDQPQALDLPQVIVNDSLQGLQRSAAAWRARFDIPTVGITGSNGKTTVKELITAVLGQQKTVLSTRGNLNNHIGVPLTLLKIADDHDYAVIEMGASHAGEIELLTNLARPDVGIVTNAGDAHLEGFGSREGVAHAKGELFAHLRDDGVAVINADDAYAPLWTELAGARRCVRFGLNVGADISARALESDGTSTRFRLTTPAGEAAVELPLTGQHNVMNALAAAAAAHALGLPAPDIAYGLAQMTPVAGRQQLRITAAGARIIDDTYNANPASLAAALDTLGHHSGERWLVLGDMAELGIDAEAAHAEAGQMARAAGVDQLYAVGPLSRAAVASFGEGGQHFTSQSALVEALKHALVPGITVLVKGSRSARMEQVVQALETAAPVAEGMSC